MVEGTVPLPSRSTKSPIFATEAQQSPEFTCACFCSQWRWYEPREDAKWEYRFKGVSEKTGNKLSQLYQPVLRRRRRSDDPAAFKCSTRFAPQDTLQLHWDVKELEEFEEQQKLQLQLKYLKSLVEVLGDMSVLFYNAGIEATSQGIWALMKHEMKDSEKMAQTADRIISIHEETQHNKILLEEILAQMQRQLKDLEELKLQTVDPRHTTSQLRLKEVIERLTTTNGILKNVTHLKQLQDKYYEITRELRGFYASCRAAKKKRTLCYCPESASVPMEVRLEIPFGIAPKTMNPILPSEVIPLPVHLAETGRISWRPSNKDYLWSEAQPLSKVDVDELSLGVTATVCLLSISAQPRSIPLLRQCGGDGSVGCNICFKVFVRQASSSACYMNCLPCAMDVIVERGAGVNAHTSIPKGDSGFFYEVDVVHDLNKKSYYLSFLPRTVKFERAASRDRGERTERPVDDEMTVFDPGNPSGDGSGARRLSLIVPYCSGLNLSFLDGDVDVHVAEEQSLIHTATGGTGSCDGSSGYTATYRDFHWPNALVLAFVQNYYSSDTNITNIPKPTGKGAYVVSITSIPAMGSCSGKTKTVTFRPRFVLANTSRQDICFKQQGTDIFYPLAVGQNINVHWSDTTRTLLLPLREHGWDWSGGFSLDRLGDTQKLRFYHKKCQKTENVLQPYSSRDYTWDEPCLPPHLVIEVPDEGTLGTYPLDVVKSYPSIQLDRSLALSTYFSIPDLRMLNPRIELALASARGFELQFFQTQQKMKMHPIGAVHCYQCIYLSIAPLRLQLEERNLTYLLGLFKGLFVGGSTTGTEKSMSFKLQRSGWVEPAKGPTQKLIISVKQRRKVYVEAFHIDPLELILFKHSLASEGEPWCSCTVPALGDRIVGTGSVSYVAFFQGMVRLHERRREPVTS
ncbi:hypothetical protein SELMODRAFT_425516 [Selaginella moellendorffii]|uniref:Vacuolar protein sorting-associated protein 13 VPS13 adaptor binding domain-containing protein n=1 Tax=Selaginella moellendorffii TaxID=88036 RepID=D8STC7_SELML|nr:hypothetical protein SELMODRAFT_425516 [Selaginella moellendorffii]